MSTLEMLFEQGMPCEPDPRFEPGESLEPELSVEPETTNKKRKSCAGRKLMRWDPSVDQFVLLAIDKVCIEQNILIPWDRVAKEVRAEGLSGEAIKQHLVKLRAGRIAAGQPVPDKVGKTARRMASAAQNRDNPYQQPVAPPSIRATNEGDRVVGEMKAANMPKTKGLVFIRPEKPTKKSRKAEAMDTTESGAFDPKPSKRTRKIKQTLPDESESEIEGPSKKRRLGYSLRAQRKPDYREPNVGDEDLRQEPATDEQNGQQFVTQNPALKLEIGERNGPGQPSQTVLTPQLPGNTGVASLASAGPEHNSALPRAAGAFLGGIATTFSGSGPVGTGFGADNFNFGSMMARPSSFNHPHAALPSGSGNAMPDGAPNFSTAGQAGFPMIAQLMQSHGHASRGGPNSYAAPNPFAGQQQVWSQSAPMSAPAHSMNQFYQDTEGTVAGGPYSSTSQQSSASTSYSHWQAPAVPEMPFAQATVQNDTPVSVSEQFMPAIAQLVPTFSAQEMQFTAPNDTTAPSSGQISEHISPIAAEVGYTLDGVHLSNSEVSVGPSQHDTPVQETVPRGFLSGQDCPLPVIPHEDQLIDRHEPVRSDDEYMPMGAFHSNPLFSEDSFGDLAFVDD